MLIIIIKQFTCIKFLPHVNHGSTSCVSIQLMPTTVYEVGGIIILIFQRRKPRHREVGDLPKVTGYQVAQPGIHPSYLTPETKCLTLLVNTATQLTEAQSIPYYSSCTICKAPC